MTNSAESANDPLIVDLALAARLERTEAITNSRFVEARQRSDSKSNGAWIEVAGTHAMFDGPDSPCTQTFGLGIHEAPSEADLEIIESFFAERGAAVHHEVAPLVPPELIVLLNDRDYHPIEFTNVMCRRIGPNVPIPTSRNPKLQVTSASPAQTELWAQTSASGWSAQPEMMQFILGFARIFGVTVGATAMFAELDGQPIATGVVAIAGGVALLAGASTVPDARNKGAQSALLAHRLQFAVEQGCDIAMICALPGSPSQRNAQRNGFQIAYTRTKWKLRN
jgi:GNAT superfamily N-acetyltransferase